MATFKRFPTKYAGVFYIEGQAIGSNKPERIYYIRYRKDGKSVEEKVGRQFQDDMTPARASGIRARKIDGELLTNTEEREKEDAERKAESNRWTLDRLSEEYFKSRPDNKSKKTDQGRYDNFLKTPFGSKQPSEIIRLDIDRLRVNLLKKKSPQTVKHILNLLSWIVNFGTKNELCHGFSFHIKKPEVHNIKTEDLNSDQVRKLLAAIEKHPHLMAGKIMKMALYSGLRRGEMFKLKWDDINFDRGFITIRQPKGGRDQIVPLNKTARELLESLPRTSQFVFPGRGGKQRTDANKQINTIKEAAGLPKNFRALHGLRHVFATTLASSGEVDMYTLQKLLTHKDPRMTQRYAHLRDDTLQKASNLAVDIFEKINEPETDSDKVVNLTPKGEK